MKKILLTLILSFATCQIQAGCTSLAESIDELQLLIGNEMTGDEDTISTESKTTDYTQIWSDFSTTLSGETISFSFPTLKRKINYVLQHGYSVGTSISDDDGAKYSLTYILQAYTFDKWSNPSTVFTQFISNTKLSKNNEIISSEITTQNGFEVLDALVYDKHEKYYSRYHYILTSKCGLLFVVHYSDGYVEQMDQVITTIQIQ